MRIILKIMLLPITFTLSVLIAVLRFVVGISSIVLRVLMILCMIGAIGAIFSNEMDLLIGTIILAFLFSPFGLEKLAVWMLALFSSVNDTIKNYRR